MQALLKKPKQQAVKLSQVSQGGEIMNFDAAKALKSLIETRNKIHNIGAALSKHTEKKEHQKILAHGIADRVMNLKQKGLDHHAIQKDLAKTKKAVKLAQKAFYDKDPKAIALL